MRNVTWLSDGHFRVQMMVRGERRSRTGWGNEADARRVRAELLLEAGKRDESLTLTQFIAGPFKQAVQTLRTRTLDGYESKLNVHVIPFLGDDRLGDVDTRRVQWWVDARLGAKVSPATTLRAFEVLRNVLRRAYEWGYISSDPTRGVRKPKVPEREVGSATVDEVNAILDLFAGDMIEAAVIIAISGGLRRSENLGLDWSHVDFKRGGVKVTRGYHDTSKGLKFEPPKSRMSKRFVPLDPWALARLKELRGVGPVTVEDGERMTPSHLSARYERIMRDAIKRKVKHVRWVPFRDLRHAYATLLLSRGVSPAIVAQMMGHSTSAITFTHYADRMDDAAEAAAAELGEALGRGKRG